MVWRKASLTLADNFIILALTIGLLVSLFILMKPYPAGQVGLQPSINVIATAQAMQTQRQQVELETAHQAQKAIWAAELDKKRQELLNAYQQGQAQIAPLQAQLSNLQGQINQTQANLQPMPQKITELQQVIQVDEAAYQNQLTALKALNANIEQVQVQPTTEPAHLSGASLTAGHEPASSSPAPADKPAATGNNHPPEQDNHSPADNDAED
jgi:hypothetical protein